MTEWMGLESMISGGGGGGGSVMESNEDTNRPPCRVCVVVGDVKAETTAAPRFVVESIMQQQ